MTEAVDLHRRYLPVEVRGPDIEHARAWFQGKLDFPVRPPRTRAPNARHARFIGARLSHVGSASAAHMMYDLGGSRVSVMAFQSPNVPLPGSTAQVVGPWHFHVDRLDGYNVAMFRDRDVTYAVTGDVEPSQMIRFVSMGLR